MGGASKQTTPGLDQCPLGSSGNPGPGTRGCWSGAQRQDRTRSSGTKGLILGAKLDPEETWILEAGAEGRALPREPQAEGPLGRVSEDGHAHQETLPAPPLALP